MLNKQRGHDQLSTFGIGATLTETQWRPIFRQLIAYGLLTVDHTLHGALTLTSASRAVLKGEQKVTLRREIKSARAPHAPVKQRANLVKELSASARACCERLRAGAARRLKRRRSRLRYFPRCTLAELAQLAPSTMSELRTVSGVGALKLERFGTQLLEVVAGEN